MPLGTGHGQKVSQQVRDQTSGPGALGKVSPSQGPDPSERQLWEKAPRQDSSAVDMGGGML